MNGLAAIYKLVQLKYDTLSLQNTYSLFYCNLNFYFVINVVFVIQALKLDIEFKDDKIAPVCSGGAGLAEELDSLSSSSEGDLRATRRPKLELLDYRVRDQASLCSVRNLVLKSGLAGQLRKRREC